MLAEHYVTSRDCGYEECGEGRSKLRTHWASDVSEEMKRGLQAAGFARSDASLSFAGLVIFKGLSCAVAR